MKNNEDLIEFLQKRNNNIISARETTVCSYKTRSAKDFNELRELFIAKFEVFDNRKLININNKEKVFMHEDTLTKIEQEIINSESRFFIDEFELNIETNAMTFFTINELIYQFLS